MKCCVKFFFLVFLALLTFDTVTAQPKPCRGDLLFTATSCDGDDIAANERELIQIINNYRRANRLKAIKESLPLSRLANRRILDLMQHMKSLTHSWSNCAYDVNQQATWNCVTEAPRRLKTGYDGKGYENIFRKNGALAVPLEALEAWKKSRYHNALILNLEDWKDVDLDAIGVAISGEYAVLWMGTQDDDEVAPVVLERGLGISLSKLTRGLSSTIKIKRDSATGTTTRWVGESKDQSISLEIIGREKEVSNTALALVIPAGTDGQPNDAGFKTALIFLANIAPDWTSSADWLKKSAAALKSRPKVPISVETSGKVFVISLDEEKRLRIRVSASLKPKPTEL